LAAAKGNVGAKDKPAQIVFSSILDIHGMSNSTSIGERQKKILKITGWGLSIILAISFPLAFESNSLAASEIPGLSARGPAPEHENKLRLFGQFIGHWEFDLIEVRPDGTKLNAKGEWHFGWVLEGRAVQDVWIVPSAKPGGTPGEYGTTVRFYDPKIDAWRVVWAGPVNADMQTFIARQVGDQIVMEGTTGDGSLVRWIFSEVTAGTFHWQGVVSRDKGKTWQLQEEMFVRRISPKN
jgi:hypothetical protein